MQWILFYDTNSQVRAFCCASVCVCVCAWKSINRKCCRAAWKRRSTKWNALFRRIRCIHSSRKHPLRCPFFKGLLSAHVPGVVRVRGIRGIREYDQRQTDGIRRTQCARTESSRYTDTSVAAAVAVRPAAVVYPLLIPELLYIRYLDAG